jgi:hypothetical protein
MFLVRHISTTAVQYHPLESTAEVRQPNEKNKNLKNAVQQQRVFGTFPCRRRLNRAFKKNSLFKKKKEKKYV